MSQELTVEAVFNDPERVARYAEGPGRMIPGYATLHRMIVQLFRESLGGAARLLVLGAGGGLELRSFTEAEPGWTFAGVDPSGPMLKQARRLLGEAAGRVEWVEGFIPDAPPGPFDAATCLLTLQMLPDDGSKLQALRAVHARLTPGAPFVVVDNCIDLTAPDADDHLRRYARFGADLGGLDDARLEQCIALAKEQTRSGRARPGGSPLGEAGFTGTELFFAGLSWRGCITYA